MFGYEYGTEAGGGCEKVVPLPSPKSMRYSVPGEFSCVSLIGNDSSVPEQTIVFPGLLVPTEGLLPKKTSADSTLEHPPGPGLVTVYVRLCRPTG